MQKNISIRIKFFSDIHKDMQLNDYNPSEGVIMTLHKGKRLKYALKTIGIDKTSPYFYFRDGQRISPWAKLKDGDEISCFKPSGGG